MRVLIGILIIACVGCAGNKEIASHTAQHVENLLAQKKFVIDSDWASPSGSVGINALYNAGLLNVQSTPNRINLIGNPNYFKVLGDSIAVDLPFYGERQLGGGYRNDSGIRFEGIPDKFEFNRNDKKRRTEIRVAFRNSPESYRAMVVLHDNGVSNITIYSSHRTVIQYTGKIQAIESDKKIL